MTPKENSTLPGERPEPSTAVTSTTMAGIIRPNPISGTVKVGGREYKYLPKIEFRAEVTGHPRIQDRLNKTVKFRDAEQTRAEDGTLFKNIDWAKAAKSVDEIIAVGTISVASAFFPEVRFEQDAYKGRDKSGLCSDHRKVRNKYRIRHRRGFFLADGK